jgi:soluble lytic murein transglycosylase-like protein
VPALIAGDEALRAAPRALATLRSPRARAAIGIPLLALAIELSLSRLHHDGPAQTPAARIIPARYAALVEREARRNGLDPRLVAAVIRQESGFDPKAHNRSSGAAGLMQLAPATARSLGVRNPHDPAQALAAGCRYLRELLDRFHGNLRLALAAYNAGPSAVSRAGGVPDFPETRDYVWGVLRRYATYRRSR